MKKILSLILCVSLLSFVLVGCGVKEEDKEDDVKDKTEQTETTDKTNENVTNDKTNENVTDDNTNDAVNEDNIVTTGWETRNLEFPNFAEIKTEVLDCPIRNKQTEIVELPFNYDINEIKSVLENSKFINDLYVLGIGKEENITGETYDAGDAVDYDVSNRIVGVLRDKYNENTKYFSDMNVSLIHQISKYKNPNELYFSFSGLELSSKTQKELYKVLKDCISEEYAEFLVYGQTTEKDYDMKVKKTIDDAVEYTFERKIVKDGDTYRITFTMSAYSWNNNYLTYFDNGYDSFYDEEFKYDTSTFVSEIDKFNPDNFSSFAKNYFKKISNEYVRTILDNAYYSVIQIDDGKNIYDFSIKTILGRENVSNITSPELNISYRLIEKDGKVVFFECDIDGTSGLFDGNEEAATAYKILSDAQIAQIKLLFPDIDISGIDTSTVTKDNNFLSTEGKIELFGNTYDFEASIDSGMTVFDMYNGCWELNIE